MEIITGIEGTNEAVERSYGHIRRIKYGIPHLAISERFPNFAFSYYQIEFPEYILKGEEIEFIPTHNRMQIQIYEYDDFAEIEEKLDLDVGFLEKNFQIGDWVKIPVKFVRIKTEKFCSHPFPLLPKPFQIPTIPLKEIEYKMPSHLPYSGSKHEIPVNNFIEGMKILTEYVILNTKFTDLDFSLCGKYEEQKEILRLSKDKDNWIKTKWKKQKENMGQIIKLINPYQNADKTEQAGRWENGKFIPRIFATDHEKRILFQDLIR